LIGIRESHHPVANLIPLVCDYELRTSSALKISNDEVSSIHASLRNFATSDGVGQFHWVSGRCAEVHSSVDELSLGFRLRSLPRRTGRLSNLRLALTLYVPNRTNSVEAAGFVLR